jgi:hypothetical protein
MAMAAQAIDDDPVLAHEHAQAAMRHAGRVAVVRETLAITAYATGDFALALRELRTVRRITGRNDHAAMIVDSERGVGRAEKALEEGRAVDREALPVAQRVELAIAMSGARLDLGQTELALHELDIPEDDPNKAYEWSAGLFAARAAVLEDLGRSDEAAEWAHRAEVAADAVETRLAEDDTVTVHEMHARDLGLDWEDESEYVDDDAEREADEAAPETAADIPTEGTAEEAGPDAPAVTVEEPADAGDEDGADEALAVTVEEPADAGDEDGAAEGPAVTAEEPADADDSVGTDAEAPEEASAEGGAPAAVDDDKAAKKAKKAAKKAKKLAESADIADDAAYDPAEGEPTIEDEVSEILAQAGITDDENGSEK